MAEYSQPTSLNPLIFHYLPLKEKVNSEEEKSTFEKYKSIILSSFPQVGQLGSIPLYQHNEQKWCMDSIAMAAAMTAQQHFVARPTDIIFSTFPKSGTTWIKALVFTILNRASGLQNCSHALNVLNPHQLVPFLELDIYADVILEVESIPSPRSLSTHLPYQALPRSILGSNARIVYLSRDPKDVLVSHWKFINETLAKSGLGEAPLEENFQLWCSGFSTYGSYWDHVQSYRNNGINDNTSMINNNNNVLFLKYEDLMEEPIENLRRLAEFVGRPFTVEEEKEDVMEKIVHLCSFNNLKNMEVNQPGLTQTKGVYSVDNSSYFRKGKVGDFRNHLTPEMIERIDQIVRENFSESDLNLLSSN